MQKPFFITIIFNGLKKGTVRLTWKFVLLSTLFSFLFLTLFQPFGLIRQAPETKMLMITGVSVIYFIGLSVVQFLVTKRRSLTIVSIELSVKIFLMINLAAVVFIGVTVNFWISAFNGNPVSILTLSKFIFYTALVHSLPCILYFYFKRHETNNDFISSLENEAATSIDPITKENVPLIGASDILFIKAEDNYVNICFEGKEKIENLLIRKTIKECTAEFGPQALFHCHRSYLVNPRRVKRITGNAKKYRAILNNCDEEIPVSRSLGPKLQQLISQF